MDESTNSISPNQLGPRSASDRTSAVAEALRAELTKSRERAGRGPHPDSEPVRLHQNEPDFASSVAVYCGDDEVAIGFRIALSAMATAAAEESAEPQWADP